MPKIEVNKVAEIIKKNQVEPAVMRRIIEEMNLAVQPDPSDEESPPAIKKQFAVILSDPDGMMPKHDFVCWVVQLPENESVATTLERIHRGAYEFNNSKKGRLLPVKTIGEALENVSAKHFKEAEVWVKTRTPILVLKTSNEIPKEAKSDGDLKIDRDIDTDDTDETDREADLELLIQAVELVRGPMGRASTSFLQRRMRIGYNTASRLMEMMEKQGVVGPENGTTPREVLPFTKGAE